MLQSMKSAIALMTSFSVWAKKASRENTCEINKAEMFYYSYSNLHQTNDVTNIFLSSYPVSHESTHGSPTFTVVYSTLAGADDQKEESNRDRRLQNRVQHNRVIQPNKGHRGFMQGVQDTFWKKAPFSHICFRS